MDKIENEVSKRGLKYSFHDNVSNALSAAVKDSNESDTILAICESSSKILMSQETTIKQERPLFLLE